MLGYVLLDEVGVPPGLRIILKGWVIQSHASPIVNAKGCAGCLQLLLPSLPDAIIVAYQC